MPDRDTIKQALVSIFVGACVAFVSHALQALLQYVQSIQLDASGAVVGATIHFLRWKTGRIG